MAKKRKTSGGAAAGAGGGAAAGGVAAAAAEATTTTTVTAGCQRCIADGVDPVALNPHCGSDDTSGSREHLDSLLLDPENVRLYPGMATLQSDAEIHHYGWDGHVAFIQKCVLVHIQALDAERGPRHKETRGFPAAETTQPPPTSGPDCCTKHGRAWQKLRPEDTFNGACKPQAELYVCAEDSSKLEFPADGDYTRCVKGALLAATPTLEVELPRELPASAVAEAPACCQWCGAGKGEGGVWFAGEGYGDAPPALRDVLGPHVALGATELYLCQHGHVSTEIMAGDCFLPCDEEAEELEAGEGIGGYGHAKWQQLQRIMAIQPSDYRHLQGLSEVERRRACQFFITPSQPRATVFDHCGCCPK